MTEQQLILGLIEESPPPLHAVVPGENAEAWDWLARVAQGEAPPGGRLLIWGGPACGKSAALRALSLALAERGQAHQFLSLAPADGMATAETDWHAALGDRSQPLLLDNLEYASEALQQALFARLVSQPTTGLLVASSGESLAGLAQRGFRDDLRTRLAQGLVYPLMPLSEDDQLRVLRQKAHALGWMGREGDTQFDGIFIYMLRRMPRHLGWLCGLLQAVDQAALAQKRPISVPLLRMVAEGFSPPHQTPTPAPPHDHAPETTRPL